MKDHLQEVIGRFEGTRVVVLCDTSGSMDVHVRFLLAFVLALKQIARTTEVFAFNTSLTRLTPWLSPGKIAHTIERLAMDVPGWSGGTRIGESLTEFVATYLQPLVTDRTVVVILSDGLVEERPARHTTKPLAGHFAKAGVPPTRRTMEFALSDGEELATGDEIKVSIFEEKQASPSVQPQRDA